MSPSWIRASEPIAVRSSSPAGGMLLRRPDNGLLTLFLDEAGARLFEIREPGFLADAPSPTFHGRDVFAPAAAHLSLGVPPEAARAARGGPRPPSPPGALDRRDDDSPRTSCTSTGSATSSSTSRWVHLARAGAAAGTRRLRAEAAGHRISNFVTHYAAAGALRASDQQRRPARDRAAGRLGGSPPRAQPRRRDRPPHGLRAAAPPPAGARSRYPMQARGRSVRRQRHGAETASLRDFRPREPPLRSCAQVPVLARWIGHSVRFSVTRASALLWHLRVGNGHRTSIIEGRTMNPRRTPCRFDSLPFTSTRSTHGMPLNPPRPLDTRASDAEGVPAQPVPRRTVRTADPKRARPS